MADERVDAVVVGAGMAGVATAFALVEAGLGRVAVLEEGAPLALTSDKSTECYRNYWPGPDSAMLEFMQASIAGLERLAVRSGDRFQLRQRGYLFATARAEEVERLGREAQQVAEFGGGPVRVDAGSYRASPAGFDPTFDGADLVTDPAVISEHFPYLAPQTKGVLHVRRCGALSAQQLGMYFLETAREGGARLIGGRFEGIETAGGRLSAVTYRDGAGRACRLAADALVIAAGPHLRTAGLAAGTDLPVKVEKHVKISLADPRGVIRRDAPLIIWNDPTELEWSAEEREMLAESEETRWLTEVLPAGVHGRPVGAGDQVLMYWTYDCEMMDEPAFPIEPDPFLAEVTLRGMAVMVPGLRAYLDPMPQPYVDGGYYTKTADNRPLIGPLSVPGTFVCGAFSGYGIMASPAAGELIAAHVTGGALAGFANAFRRERFDDAAYVAGLEGLALTAQL